MNDSRGTFEISLTITARGQEEADYAYYLIGRFIRDNDLRARTTYGIRRLDDDD